MATDGRTNIINDHVCCFFILHKEFFTHKSFVKTVSMVDADSLLVICVAVRITTINNVCYKLLECILSASCDACRNQVTFFVNSHNGLELKHTANDCNCFGNSAAALEIFKVINCKPMRKLMLFLVEPCTKGIEIHSVLFLVQSTSYQKTVTTARAERVDHLDLSIGIFLKALISCNTS